MKYYLHRDVSWMYFNYRILQEARKEHVPLLERLTFLGIYSNNLDEFYRVRMATLSRIADYEDKSARSQQEESRLLIKQINKLNNKYSKEFEQTIAEIKEKLCEENICLIGVDELSEEQQQFVHSFFQQKLSGYINPIWLSAVKQIADETDENIYLAIKMSDGNGKSRHN